MASPKIKLERDTIVLNGTFIVDVTLWASDGGYHYLIHGSAYGSEIRGWRKGEAAEAKKEARERLLQLYTPTSANS